MAGNKDATAAGKQLFATNCVACHGVSGKGDGPASAALNPKPANLGDAAVRKQSDGALFWKVTQGHTPMPAWAALPEAQRWQLVNYVRTFASK